MGDTVNTAARIEQETTALQMCIPYRRTPCARLPLGDPCGRETCGTDISRS